MAKKSKTIGAVVKDYQVEDPFLSVHKIMQMGLT